MIYLQDDPRMTMSTKRKTRRIVVLDRLTLFNQLRSIKANYNIVSVLKSSFINAIYIIFFAY